MTLYAGMPNGADPIEYPPWERPEGVVSYTTGKTCPNGHDCNTVGAFWDNKGPFCCCACGCGLGYWESSTWGDPPKRRKKNDVQPRI